MFNLFISSSRYARQDSYMDNDLYYEKETNHYLQDHPRHFQEHPRFFPDSPKEEKEKQSPKRDEIMNTKFVYSEEPNLSVKLSELKAMPHFRPTNKEPNVEKKKIPEKKIEETKNNVVFENSVYENVTVGSVKPTEENFTTEATVDKTTTEAETSETTTEEFEEESATEDINKKKPSAVLFQDMDDSNKVSGNMNYKLRGV